MPISELHIEQAAQREEEAAEARAVAILNGTEAIAEELTALRAALNSVRDECHDLRAFVGLR
jgi:hypothetical protein